MKQIKTPGVIDALIDKYAPGHLAEEIRGDLVELYRRDLHNNGKVYADARYCLNAIRFMSSSFFWKHRKQNRINTIMLGTYFKMAQRALMAYKSNTIINVVGLVIGIAAAIVIFTFVRYESSFDKFHSDYRNIYRLVRVSGTNLEITEKSECRTGISYPVPTALREELQGIEEVAAIESVRSTLIEVPNEDGKIAKRFEESGVAIAESSFFNIFDFKDTDFRWLEGNPATALKQPYEIVLTESSAAKYFGTEEVIGKSLLFEKQINCKVVGVISDLPNNTDFPFKVFVSYETLKLLASDRMNDWYSVNDDHHTYIKIKEGADIGLLNTMIKKVHAKHTPKELHDSRHYLLQHLEAVHHDSRFGNFSGRTVSQETTTGLMIIAMFLLLAASINYINLATAQASMRSKEIGLRKVMGSNRFNLALQLYAETFLVVLVSTCLAIGAAHLLLINLQPLVGNAIDAFHLKDMWLPALVVVLIVVLSFFSGFYPSLVISGLNPVAAIRNKFSTTTVGGASMRKLLVVAQFAITQMLVIGTFIVVAQMQFFKNQQLGFEEDAIVTVRVPNSEGQKFKVLRDQLMALPNVSAASFSSTLPSGRYRNHSYSDIGPTEETTPGSSHVYENQCVDSAYFRLYNISLIAGRALMPADSIGNVVINEALVSKLGASSANEMIGRKLRMHGRVVTVVGVTGNFYSNSLKGTYENMAFEMNERAFSYLSIKLNSLADVEGSLAEIEGVWKSNFPEYVYDYSFFDENISAFYEQEEKYAMMFQYFSFVFLAIGCLGLYGLVTFVIARKGKEVAIRKVLGANISSILLLFSKEYVQLIIVSFFLAIPVSYFFVNDWLSNFENRIELQWPLFLIPGLAVLFIAVSVVSLKSFRAANSNPTQQLKIE